MSVSFRAIVKLGFIHFALNGEEDKISDEVPHHVLIFMGVALNNSVEFVVDTSKDLYLGAGLAEYLHGLEGAVAVLAILLNQKPFNFPTGRFDCAFRFFE